MRKVYHLSPGGPHARQVDMGSGICKISRPPLGACPGDEQNRLIAAAAVEGFARQHSRRRTRLAALLAVPPGNERARITAYL